MRVSAAAALLALVLAAPAAAEDVPTLPVTTAPPPPTTTAPPPVTTTTAPPPPVTTTAPAPPPVTTTAPAPEPAPRISVPAEVSGTYDAADVAVEVAGVPAEVSGPLRTLGIPLSVTPSLDAGPYVFPVSGDVSWGDSYGGERSDVPGGWHHGDDLFAKLGQPVLAVADGHVYKVGWQRIGGWRLWLKDHQGNRFYYAHLSGYAPLAKNQAEVQAGDVIGYIGHTGDAFTTPFHLHFEIHPVSLLWMHYNGAVDPSSYLSAWRRVTATARPRPAPLPSGAAAHGEGALSDYRRLLSLFPSQATAAKTVASAPVDAPQPVAAGARLAATHVKASSAPQWPVLVAVTAVAIWLAGTFFLVRRRRAGGGEGPPPPADAAT